MSADTGADREVDTAGAHVATAPTTRERIGRLRPVFALGPVSTVWRRYPVVVITVLALLAFLALCLSVSTGDFDIPLLDVVRVVVGGGDEAQRFIVQELRMPRAVTGLVVGAALGLSGSLVQAVARNPLASPDILGVTSGAGAAAVFVLTGVGGLAGRVDSVLGLTWAALLGGLLTGAAVYGLAWRGGVSGYRLILIGVAVTSLMQALIEWMLLRVRIERVSGAQAWLFGSLGDTSWSDVWPTLIGLLVLGAVAGVISRLLPALHLSDDHALGLGVRLNAARAVLLVAAVLLVGIATAACGPVAFVAFVAPQIAMRAMRVPSPPLLGSALTGAVLLVLADWLARFVLPFDLPVGVVTSMVGGPFMVYLLVQQSRRSTV